MWSGFHGEEYQSRCTQRVFTSVCTSGLEVHPPPLVLVPLRMLTVRRSTLGLYIYVSRIHETMVLVRSPSLLEDGGGLPAHISFTFTHSAKRRNDIGNDIPGILEGKGALS